jgi:hypothetical protein
MHRLTPLFCLLALACSDAPVGDWDAAPRLPGEQVPITTNTLTLSGPSAVVDGETYAWTVTGPTLGDGDQVNLAWGGTTATQAGPCPFRGLIGGTLCMDIAAPARPFGSAIVSGGSATFTRVARPTAMTEVHLQVISVDGPESATSNVLTVDLLRPSEDSDGDGITNTDELNRGTDPLNADTDGDRVDDGDEIANGTDPLVVDPCGDAQVPGLNRCVFDHTADEQFFIVPDGVGQITATMWGGGGGSPDRFSSITGGGGGYSAATLNGVSGGDALLVVVGGGGEIPPPNATVPGAAGGFGGGGDGFNEVGSIGFETGGGGGLSGVFDGAFTQADALLIAGGGGGASDDPAAGGNGGDYVASDAARSPVNGGLGGSQVAGGLGGTGNASVPPGGDGSALQGGHGTGAGAGGGGGYFGGGGGSGLGPGAGAGGSSFAHPTRASNLDIRIGDPGGASPLNAFNDGQYGRSIFNQPGRPGRVVIEW